MEIKAKPSPPTIVLTSSSSVCTPATLNLTASGCAGIITWSNAATGTSLTISAVGTYLITATCTVNGCTSDASTAVPNLEIKQTPAAPTIGATTPLIVCEPSTLNLTASGCAGTVTWSNAATGTSLTISAVGTYSITATCTVNDCPSPASTAVSALEIKAKPAAPTITLTSAASVCTPSTLNLTASGCAGTVVWSQGAASGTSLTLSAVGTYSITATCMVNGCTSDASNVVAGLEIKQTPNAPTITLTTASVVCEPSTLNLTASGCAGTVTWSNAATGTSLTLSTVGTYSITAICTINGCPSGASNVVNGLEIKAKPAAPTITLTSAASVCTPSTLNLTASGCAGIITWSNAATGTSLTLSTVGTYSITATCMVNGCTSDASNVVAGLEIKQTPNAPTITLTTASAVCEPSTLNLTASGCAGTVTWSNAATGTSLTISTVGTYSITAICTINGCPSGASNIVNGLEIKAKPAAPTITLTSAASVCTPSTLNLTASGCAGIITWSNAATGTSLTLSAVGTYSITATCAVNGCTSDASTAVSGLEIKQTPAAPTIGATTASVVCSPSTLNLTASGCAGTVTWSNAATGTSLTLSTVGTYSITATCTVNGCPSPASTAVSGLEIKTKPAAPTIGATTPLVVCTPATLNLTATGCAGSVTWSNAATGTSLTISAVGTYSITATCSVNDCTSDASTAVSGLEIKQTPAAPTIGATTASVVCSPSTINLTASGCSGTVTWSNAATGTSLTLSAVGTYSITAICTVNGCPSGASNVVNGLEIKALPNAQASNTGPYSFGQTINLSASGGSGTPLATYSWSGPNSFSSTIANPSIFNAQIPLGGIYSVTVTNVGCSASATTEVIVSGIDPCVQILAYDYVLAGNPSQTLFNLTSGQNIAQRPAATSIIVRPICNTVTIGSVDMTITGPSLNWTILQNVEPFALFDNSGPSINGQVLAPGTYSLTVTGYFGDNRTGGTTYGPIITSFTILGNAPTISMPTFTGTEFCAGANINVSFTTTGTFAGGNLFQVLLSDANGNFNSPQIIGTTTVAGSVICNIPPLTMGGENYRIKVVSTDPAASGNYSPVALTVNPLIYNLVSPTNDYPFGTATKKAIETINARNNITGASRINYKAGNAINLTPGFQVVSGNGSSFKAQIEGCSN